MMDVKKAAQAAFSFISRPYFLLDVAD